MAEDRSTRVVRRVSANPDSAALCGLSAVLLAFVVTVIGGALRPDYSHVSQYVSELGELGAVHASVVNAFGFVPIGVLVMLFLILAQRSLPRSIAARIGSLCMSAVGAAYLAAAVFPCEPGCPPSGSASQAVHSLFGVLEYTGATAGALFLSVAFRRDERWRSLVPYSRVVALTVGIAFLAMSSSQLEPYRGLFQRMAEMAIFFWIALVSVFLVRTREVLMAGDPSV